MTTAVPAVKTTDTVRSCILPTAASPVLPSRGEPGRASGQVSRNDFLSNATAPEREKTPPDSLRLAEDAREKETGSVPPFHREARERRERAKAPSARPAEHTCWSPGTSTARAGSGDNAGKNKHAVLSGSPAAPPPPSSAAAALPPSYPPPVSGAHNLRHVRLPRDTTRRRSRLLGVKLSWGLPQYGLPALPTDLGWTAAPPSVAQLPRGGSLGPPHP